MFKISNWKSVAVLVSFILITTIFSVFYFTNDKPKDQVSNSNSSTSQDISNLESSSLSSTSSSKNSDSSSLANETSLKVFFSKNPESLNDFNYTKVVTRSTTRKDVGTFVIEQVIAGPTTTEITEGLFTPIKLKGSSNCDGKDFSLSISNKVGNLKFCKQIETSGIGDDARINSVITDSLKQFPTIEKVIILTKDDNCFGDLSGLNLCKSGG